MLGKLSKVNLRTQWPHEALDFTRWLAQEENLAAFCEEVGVSLRLVQTEATVGRFNVDILAEEETTGKRAVIENQLESTDHSYLGQIITYASGLGAEFIFWVVRDVREEHRQAVDWLNEHTDEGINFFLLQIELWQIGESLAAPKFNVVCRPNNWTKLLRKGGSEGGRVTDTKAMQVAFWEGLRAYAAQHHPEMRLRAPRP